MLSKDAKTALKTAKAKNGQLSYKDIQALFGCDSNKAKSICDHLINEGYATERTHHPLPGSEISWGISLTEKGRNSRKFFWSAFGMSFLKDIAIPVVVSIVTAIITTIVTTIVLS